MTRTQRIKASTIVELRNVADRIERGEDFDAQGLLGDLKHNFNQLGFIKDRPQRDAFVRGIATILWGLKWADHAEGHGCYNLSGCEITEHMPEIPELAWQWAERLAGRIEGECGHTWPILFAAALKADGLADDDNDGIDYHGELAQRFGECCYYMAAGHGVSWFDDHEKFDVPSYPPKPFDIRRVSTDEAEQALEDYAAESCDHEGGRPRCKSCGQYNDPDRRETCEGCGTDVEVPPNSGDEGENE